MLGFRLVCKCSLHGWQSNCGVGERGSARKGIRHGNHKSVTGQTLTRVWSELEPPHFASLYLLNSGSWEVWGIPGEKALNQGI
jgi:hypothetical protein